jgi:hypothetical protein
LPKSVPKARKTMDFLSTCQDLKKTIDSIRTSARLWIGGTLREFCIEIKKTP